MTNTKESRNLPLPIRRTVKDPAPHPTVQPYEVKIQLSEEIHSQLLEIARSHNTTINELLIDTLMIMLKLPKGVPSDGR